MFKSLYSLDQNGSRVYRNSWLLAPELSGYKLCMSGRKSYDVRPHKVTSKNELGQRVLLIYARCVLLIYACRALSKSIPVPISACSRIIGGGEIHSVLVSFGYSTSAWEGFPMTLLLWGSPCTRHQPRVNSGRCTPVHGAYGYPRVSLYAPLY